MISDINADNSTDCADISISKYVADGLISTAIYARNPTNCAEGAAGGLMDAINAENFD